MHWVWKDFDSGKGLRSFIRMFNSDISDSVGSLSMPAW